MSSATLITESMSRQNRGYRTLALVVGLLTLPFLLATLLWSFGWHPERAINHGELMIAPDRPALQISESQLQNIVGNATHPEPILGQWLLALAVPNQCESACTEQLLLARQVHVSLNKEMSRLKRAVIGPQLDWGQSVNLLKDRWPDLMIARTHLPKSLPIFRDDSAPHLLLIDPQGRIVLRYSPTPDPKGLRRDVERLLKYSWIG